MTVFYLAGANPNPGQIIGERSLYRFMGSLNRRQYRLSFFVRSLHGWINDAVMTLFFFLIALELKRELVLGELRNPRLAILSFSATIGGMLVPAYFYGTFAARLAIIAKAKQTRLISELIRGSLYRLTVRSAGRRS